MSERSETAQALWRLADQAKAEAREHRERASALDREALRLERIAQAVFDGLPLSQAQVQIGAA